MSLGQVSRILKEDIIHEMRKFLKPSALATVLFLLLQGLGTERSRSAEPTRVDFNGSLTNTSGQFNGVSDSNLSYITENNRTAVSFSSLEHVRFPMGLSNSLDSQRLRFRIRFKISPDSQGKIGVGRILFAHLIGLSEEFFSITNGL